VDIDLAVSRLKVKIKRTDDSILREVREQSQAADKGKKDLGEAKQTIQALCASLSLLLRRHHLHAPLTCLPLCWARHVQELFGRIHEIKRKAGESETMVQEICSDIKSLDYAKKYSFPSRLSLARLID
jgi:hypothetical protein